MQADLGDDLGAFQLRYDARLITASQTVPTHPRFAAVAKIELAALRQEHKRAIFAFHADQPIESVPAHCWEPFSTAFDLSIAGRCQSNGAITQTRAELYDLYARSALPSMSARSVLRKLAWYMGENFKPALTVGDYERLVENFVRQLAVPLTLADELLKSRLLAVEREVIAFEHDLLKDYFRAEHLLRETDPDHLVAKLQEPKYAELAEFVAPSLSDDHVLRELLANADAKFLNMAFRGRLGAAARRIVRGECRRLLTECRDRLPEVEVEAPIEKLSNGQRLISARVVGSSCVSDLDQRLCAVAADNLDDDLIRDDFLNLLDLGEWALREASDRAASQLHIKPIAVWRELIRLNVFMNPPEEAVHPVLFICHQVPENLMRSIRRPHLLPIHDALLQKVREGNAGAFGILLLMFDLRFRDWIDMADVLAIARQAWDTNVYVIRLEALDLLQSNARAIREAGPEAETAVVGLLETFDVGNNIGLSTAWMETRSCFAGFEIGIDVDNALDEFRGIIATAAGGDDPLYQLQRKADPNITFSQFIASCASGTLGKIFEDIFQGAYYEAYELLRAEEKKTLLILALQDTRIGLFTDWYISKTVA